MSKKMKVNIVILVTLCLTMLTSCYKVTTLTVATDEEVTGPVSLTKDLVPLFNASCNMSGCHNSGGVKPDLSGEKLYNTMLNGGYINPETPENSEIYLWMTGKRASPMPVGVATNPGNINQYLLAWIKQGAQNN